MHQTGYFVFQNQVVSEAQNSTDQLRSIY